nr:DNA polymerase III subunit gamma and tau [Kribbella pratensis]
MEAPLALYRRYRPETFAEVIGQDHVTAPLRNALSNNRVNHAYLFSGPRGCGKTTSARILARAINCEKGPIAEPCGVCKSCTDLARGGPGSIDVIEIDAASHGGVDDARDLRERAFFAPVESRYKIYIIDEAHMVTTQGFNALLKLVEEPPPHLKFIFATTEPDKVIGTIRSRTHHYPFRLVPPKVLADYMAKLCESEGVAIEPAALPLVVRAGAGSVRDSLSVLDQLIGGAGPEGVTYELAVALLGFTPDSLLDACVDGFAAHDSAAVFETIEKVIETGQDPKRFAEDLLRRLRDLVVLSAVPNAVVSGLIEAAEDQGERLQTQAAGIGPAELTRAADIVAAGLLEMRGATAPRLQLELICAKVLLPGADDSTNGIQARLDRMERRLDIGTPAGTPGGAQPATAPAGQPPASGAANAVQPSGAGTPGAVAPGGASDDSGVPGADAASSRAAARAAASGGGPAQAESADGPADDVPAGRAGAGDAGPAAPTPAAAPSAGSASSRSAAGARGSSGGAGGGRTGAWGDGAESSAVPVGASDVAASEVATGGGAAGSGGAVGLADIRRLWPEVLEAVKSKRRFAWIMLSQNAQVIAIDDQTLTLGLVNAGARESFARSGSDEILRQAMNDTIGIDRRVEAVVDPSTDPGAAGSGNAGGPGGSGGAGGPGGRPSGGHSGGAPGGFGGGAPGGHGGGPAGPGGGAAGGSSGGAGGGPAGAADAATGGVPAGGGPGGGGDAAGAGRGLEAAGMAGSGASGSDAGGPGGPGGPGEAGRGVSGSDAYGSDLRGAGSVLAEPAGAGPGGPGTEAPAGRGSAGGGADGVEAAGRAGGGSGLGRADGRGSAGRAGAAAGAGAGARAAGEAGAAAGAAGGAGAGREWADAAGSVALREPPDSEWDVPPGSDPWDDQRAPVTPQAAPVDRREQAASKRRAAEAAVAAEQARAAARAPVVPEAPLTPEEEAASIGEDDVVLDDDPRTHTELLRETLGAQMITEEAN